VRNAITRGSSYLPWGRGCLFAREDKLVSIECNARIGCCSKTWKQLSLVVPSTNSSCAPSANRCAVERRAHLCGWHWVTIRRGTGSLVLLVLLKPQSAPVAATEPVASTSDFQRKGLFIATFWLDAERRRLSLRISAKLKTMRASTPSSAQRLGLICRPALAFRQEWNAVPHRSNGGALSPSGAAHGGSSCSGKYP